MNSLKFKSFISGLILLGMINVVAQNSSAEQNSATTTNLKTLSVLEPIINSSDIVIDENFLPSFQDLFKITNEQDLDNLLKFDNNDWKKFDASQSLQRNTTAFKAIFLGIPAVRLALKSSVAFLVGSALTIAGVFIVLSGSSAGVFPIIVGSICLFGALVAGTLAAICAFFAARSGKILRKAETFNKAVQQFCSNSFGAPILAANSFNNGELKSNELNAVLTNFAADKFANDTQYSLLYEYVLYKKLKDALSIIEFCSKSYPRHEVIESINKIERLQKNIKTVLNTLASLPAFTAQQDSYKEYKLSIKRNK